MPVAILVVHRYAALEEASETGRIERLGKPRIVQGLGLVEQEAAISVCRSDQCGARVVGQGKGAFEFLGPLQQFAERFMPQPFEDQHLRAAEQRGV